MNGRDARFSFIGFGELGFALAAGLRRSGARSVTVFVREGRDAASAAALASRISTANVGTSESMEDAVRSADVVLSVVPASAAAEVAIAAAGVIEEGCVYVDVAPLPPAVKEGLAERMAARRSLYVDAAVLGTVVTDGFEVPILASGPGAEKWRAIVTPLGMHVSVIEGAPGRATLVKLLRSVYTKGRDALILEMMVAARRHGVDDVLLASLEGRGERVPFPALVERTLCSLALHAGRRADELEHTAAVVRDAGGEPLVTLGGYERLRWAAALGLRERLSGERPESLADALAAIDASNQDTNRAQRSRRDTASSAQ